MKIILIIIGGAGFIASCFWYYHTPGWEPIVGIAASLGTFISSFLSKKDKGDSKTRMSQKSGSGSTNYQSGRDTNIGK